MLLKLKSIKKVKEIERANWLSYNKVYERAQMHLA